MNSKIFVVVIALVAATAPVYGATVIFLPGQAQVKGLSFTLGEIAEIRQGNPRLARLPLGATPAPGRIVYYSRQQLAELLRKGDGHDRELEWRGAYEVAVQTQSVAVATSELAALAQEFLEMSLAWPAADRQCQLISTHHERILLPEPRTSLQFQPRHGTRSPSGRSAVEIAIFIDNQCYRRLEFLFAVRLWQTVFLTASFLRRHTLLTTDNLMQRRLDVTRLRQRPLTSSDDWRGQRTKYNLPAKRILSRDDIEPAPDITRGAVVMVIFHSANLTIKLRARALEDGYRGRRIRVARIPGNQILQARVRDRDCVEFSGD